MSENYVIRQGDCLSSLAHGRGFLWETIWEHPNNSAPRRKRKDPNILLPGDILFIPEKELKQVPAATEQRHDFVLKGTPAKLRLRILEEIIEPPAPAENSADAAENPAASLNPVYETPARRAAQAETRPRRNVSFRLKIDGETFDGTTDDDGRIEIKIPPNARNGKLVLEPGTLREKEIAVNLGHLNPLEEISGIKQRLRNLGFNGGAINDESDSQFAAAIKSFQGKSGQTATGVLDEATRRKILEIHGS